MNVSMYLQSTDIVMILDIACQWGSEGWRLRSILLEPLGIFWGEVMSIYL